MINRHLIGFGIHPVLGYGILALGFAGLSAWLFSKTDFADYIYVIIALTLISKLSETKRNEFLQICFADKTRYKIRLIENVAAATPFFLFLMYHAAFIPIAILTGSALLLAFYHVKSQFNLTVPTPFYKYPFEFIIGFRNTFYFITAAFFITFMAVATGNFNLGIFALILVFFTSISFYVNPENDFFVWIYRLTPGQFLIMKIKIALLFATFLVMPVTIALCTFFSSEIPVILGFQALCDLYLATIILAKYSVFPHQMNLPQMVIIALSVGFPPLLVGIIPFFIFQSVNRLKWLLQ
ncbi:MAG: ABC transporter permease [Bacteroidetes bacterium]|nr:ABC transporter permease [Bacteroidota bacterium]